MNEVNKINNYICIYCEEPIKDIYKKYSETVLKLSRCENCKKLADQYVEFDMIIIVIDLILLKPEAYRHILLNYNFKHFWKLSIILLIMESYAEWVLSSEPVIKKTDEFVDTLENIDLYLEDYKFYRISLLLAMKSTVFTVIIYIISKYFIRRKLTSFLLVWKLVTLSSIGIFLLLPTLIWDVGVQELNISCVTLYITISQLIAYKAVCGVSFLKSFIVIISALYCKSLVSDFWHKFITN